MRVITIEEYFRLGVDKVIAEARAWWARGGLCQLDVDGLDPAYAPAPARRDRRLHAARGPAHAARPARAQTLVAGDVVEVSRRST